MEDSDVRTVNWLMQAGDDEVDSEEDDDSLDQGSDVAQSDSLTVTTSSQSSHPAPEQDVDHTAVDSAECPPQCSKDMAPPETVHPDETPLITDPTDMSPPDNVPTDLALPDHNPPDIDSRSLTPQTLTPLRQSTRTVTALTLTFQAL
ncbi:hypothetical protein NHX12_032522 [Muraenolepis orangiensis]|uniref:Uncharacterized protein n=1 Tax=Muraenolepis orangiensis TaxID=630683 RepID=A0A9Q0IJY1_9TELE|nr:hypothetical protein NHX12_032522 [Muraenolepis orangiensis]